MTMRVHILIFLSFMFNQAVFSGPIDTSIDSCKIEKDKITSTYKGMTITTKLSSKFGSRETPYAMYSILKDHCMSMESAVVKKEEQKKSKCDISSILSHLGPVNNLMKFMRWIGFKNDFSLGGKKFMSNPNFFVDGKKIDGLVLYVEQIPAQKGKKSIETFSQFYSNFCEKVLDKPKLSIFTNSSIVIQDNNSVLNNLNLLKQVSDDNKKVILPNLNVFAFQGALYKDDSGNYYKLNREKFTIFFYKEIISRYNNSFSGQQDVASVSDTLYRNVQDELLHQDKDPNKIVMDVIQSVSHTIQTEFLRIRHHSIDTQGFLEELIKEQMGFLKTNIGNCFEKIQ